MRRIGLDQTTAWMLAVFFAVVTFGGLYGVAKMGASDGSGDDGHHESAHGDDSGKHRVEADDPHGEAPKGHAETSGAPGHEPAHETAPAAAPPASDAHGEHPAPAADKHHK